MATITNVITSIKSFLTSKYLALTGGKMSGGIEREGTAISWRDILNASKKNSCGLYQSTYNGYMPMLNMMTTDGRCGIGTYQNYLALTYFLNTNETNSADCSVYINTNGMTIKGKNVVCVESGTSGNFWYRKYADGWIEQGGLLIPSSGDNNYLEVTVTLPIAFSNTNYIALSTGTYTTHLGSSDAVVTKKTTTQVGIKAHIYKAGVEYATFYCCGR